ncbi:lysylphosphatidylglycerol synthase domain-containing protein [Dokdonella sp.]|uniref:lysylphosphatidylglycerol synthase domain-containing protein n=1 Tax=Dokdonella sp. TaxID=2291710 RepID=UPI0025B964C7|nr:lysylphosphatidylglycerol synthase domain-containing protein [Dokdonella sp.]
MRRLLRGLGLLVSLAALVWIGLRFAHSDAFSVFERVEVGTWRLGAALAASAVAYALALATLAFAWWRLLVGLSPEPPPKWATLATWCVSQYGKYLPGNVAHYALRHAWSRHHATSHTVLGLAALIEAALLLLTALALALCFGTSSLPLPGVDLRIALVLVLAGSVVGILVLHWLRRHGHFARLSLPRLPPTMLASVFACDLAFFAATATILYGLGHLLGANADWPLMLAAGAASWAAGFIVIGAPAGLGVREVAFVALAGSTLGEDRALLLIALYRLVTFFGDTLAFAIGALLMRRARAADPDGDSATL